MGTAVEWERENESALNDVKAAIANNDPYLAIEILNRIAPAHDGEHAVEPESAGDALYKSVFEAYHPKTMQLHCTHGPALVKGDGSRYWYFNGMLHNPSGPAKIKPNGDLSYYYLGTKCKTAEDLDDMVRRANKHAKNNTLQNA